MQQWLADLKVQDPEKWKHFVRQCRVCPLSSSDPSSAIGVPNNSARAAKVATFVQQVSQFLTVQERIGVAWYNECQYISYKCNKENMTHDEAKEAFAKDVANPTIVKRGTKEDPIVPVRKADKTEGIRGKTVSNGMIVENLLGDRASLETAQERMRFGSLNANVTDGDFQEVGGAMFRSGAASSSFSEVSAASCPTPASSASQPLALRLGDEDLPFESGASGGSASGRALTRVPSNPQNPSFGSATSPAVQSLAHRFLQYLYTMQNEYSC